MNDRRYKDDKSTEWTVVNKITKDIVHSWSITKQQTNERSSKKRTKTIERILKDGNEWSNEWMSECTEANEQHGGESN